MKTPRRIPTSACILRTFGLAASRASGAAGDEGLSFDPGSWVNDMMNAVVVQAHGKVLIGGGFNYGDTPL